MKRASCLSLLPVLALLGLSLPRLVSATTFQMMADSDLADRAKVIAGVQVLGSEPAATGDRKPATDYRVQVERVVKGSLPGSTVIVRVPGGDGPGGIGLRIYGAPHFQEGERALLFLTPAADGTWRILHLMLGAFHVRGTAGKELALRNLDGAHEVVPAGKQATAEETRDLGRFADWLADRATGVKRSRDYLVRATLDKYTFMTGDDGKPVRWFSFDSGQSVSWVVQNGGQPGLGTDATVAAFNTALQAWNNDSATNILYNDTGVATSAGAGINQDDGLNEIFFNAGSNETGGTFDCDAGGVIAAGGPFYYTSTRTFQGAPYHEIVEANIGVNAGTQCLFQNNPSGAAEVFAHELGHTLGLGHSTNRQALMYANIHNDGRGASLTADDAAAVAVLYPAGSSGGGGGTGGGGGSGGGGGGGGGGTSACASSTTTLCLDSNRFRVEVSWHNQHNGTASGQGKVTRTSDASGAVTFFDPTAVDLIVKVLDGRSVNNRFWVFAGSLTDVEFWLKVTDTQTGAVRTYHNRPGDTRGLADTAAFVPQGSSAATNVEVRTLTPTAPAPTATIPAAVAPSACTAGANALCLGGRFRITARWRNQRNGATGTGGAIGNTASTGSFWFFDKSNVELVLKALDGRGVNGKLWIFYGALTDVEYWVTVTDTQTGRGKVYHSKPGSLSGLADTQAF